MIFLNTIFLSVSFSFFSHLNLLFTFYSSIFISYCNIISFYFIFNKQFDLNLCVYLYAGISKSFLFIYFRLTVTHRGIYYQIRSYLVLYMDARWTKKKIEKKRDYTVSLEWTSVYMIRELLFCLIFFFSITKEEVDEFFKKVSHSIFGFTFLLFWFFLILKKLNKTITNR